MKVFKFGGASVSTPERVRHVAAILQQHRHEQLLVVISAMGKTTNALEKVAQAFHHGDKALSLQLFDAVKQYHADIVHELLGAPVAQLTDYFTEVEWLLHDAAVRPYDYYYDQIVCIGELLSTCIVSHYLHQHGQSNHLLDVRDVLRTDNQFRDARIDWTITAQKVQEQVLPALQSSGLVIAQGFIGATDENESTTLGREGSDYSAAVFAHLLDADAQVIWKDVPGVMNADPKLYPQAQLIEELSYREVIEMAYYGAQVIHPKTIKPLQNKNIPLLVRSFLQLQTEGTRIHHKSNASLPPIVVYKSQQVLLQLSSRDYSFVSEGLAAQAYRLFEDLNFRPNLTQIAAISLLCILDDQSDKVERFAQAAAHLFDVQLQKGLTLLTIRHYDEAILSELCSGKAILLRQQTPETIQVLLESQ